MKATEPEILSGAGGGGGGAMELVAQGHALIRIENETMMQVAVQRPRDEGVVIKGALRELELVPEEAGKAYYSIPYTDRQTGKVTKVEGPSIKAAMALARRWGNCTTGARVLNEDKEGFDVEGVFIDLETNFRITRPQRVSKWFKPRAGGMQQLTIDRQMMAVQAGASKAIRNAILAGLPAYLVGAYDKKARAIVAGKLDAPADAKTTKAVLDAFAKWAVTREQLEGYAELPVEQWTGTQIADLRGLWNAIHDGQATVAEAFGIATETPAATPGETTVTPDSLVGAAVTGENGQHPGGPEQQEREAVAMECRAMLERIAFKPEVIEHMMTKALGTTVMADADVAALTDFRDTLRKIEREIKSGKFKG